jgi:hypothetical protein
MFRKTTIDPESGLVLAALARSSCLLETGWSALFAAADSCLSTLAQQSNGGQLFINAANG